MVKTRPSSSTKKLSFFKILVGDFKKRLRIPQAFVKHISEEESFRRAILEGPSGNCWSVGLIKTDKGLYFEDGWETFIRDHSLTVYELLVFTYTSDMCFRVMTFGKNACERVDAFTAKSSQGSTFGQGKKCYSTDGEGNSVSSSKLETERLNLTGKRNAREAAIPFNSHLPYFVSEIKVSCVRKPFNLTVPAYFAKEHLPRETKKLVLQDVTENEWVVNLHVRENQSAFCGGWKRFSVENNLRLGDYCVFELAEESKLIVHIFRCWLEHKGTGPRVADAANGGDSSQSVSTTARVQFYAAG